MLFIKNNEKYTLIPVIFWSCAYSWNMRVSVHRYILGVKDSRVNAWQIPHTEFDSDLSYSPIPELEIFFPLLSRKFKYSCAIRLSLKQWDLSELYSSCYFFKTIILSCTRLKSSYYSDTHLFASLWIFGFIKRMFRW